MAVVPRGFDQHAPDVGIAGFGNCAARLLRPAGMLRGHQADEGHEARGRGKATRVPQFGGDREGGEIVDAAETAEALDPGLQRLDRQEIT
jgi:hypothetical protein